MDIDDESGRYESSSVTHEHLLKGDLVREVRWYRDNGNAYWWSERAGRWIYLGETTSIDGAESRAQADMYNLHS